MELSMGEIALIHIACRAMLENNLQQKDRTAYESLLCRLTIAVKGKKMSVRLDGKDELTLKVPAYCMEIGGPK